MADSPGIRFQESEVQLAPIAVGASLSAFIGQSSRGRVDKAQRVSSWAEYTQLYGGFGDNYDLSLALWDYFRNGGSSAYIQRLPGSGAVQAHSASTLVDHNATAPLRIYAADPGKWGNSLSVSIYRKSALASAQQRLTSAAEVDLPTGEAPNWADSHAVAEIPLSSARDVRVGDVFAAYDPVTGAKVAGLTDAIVVVDVDAANKAIRYIKPNQALPNGVVLKSASRHLGRAKATGQLAHNGGSLAVDSVAGFEKGSMVSIISSSVYDNTESNLHHDSRVIHANAVVDKIVGKTLHFVDPVALPGNVAAPAAVAAKDKLNAAAAAPAGMNASAACILTATAVTAGAAGNSIVLKFVSSDDAAHASGSVSVAGQGVTVTYQQGATKASELVTLLANSTLVNLATTGDGNQTFGAAAGSSLTLTLSGGADLRVVSQEFDLVLKEDGVEVESGRHTGLSLQSASSNYIGTRLGGSLDATFGYRVPSDSSQSVRILVDNLVAVAAVGALPFAVEDLSLAAGADGAAITDDEVVGSHVPRKGLHLFDEHDDIDLLLAPGFTSAYVQQKIVAYAEGRADLLALLDMPSSAISSEDMAFHREHSLGSSSSYGAIYAPYGKMADPRPSVPRGSLVQVPPTPAVAALMAKRADAQGPHVPAANQEVRWAGLLVNVTEADHGALNDLGINIIRLVRRTGIKLYGARTLSSAGDGRRFTNVRRWLNFMKQSLGARLQGFIFRPAGNALFADIESSVDRFLSEQHSRGALYPQDRKSSAYFVKCDSETTSAADLGNGVVNCEIGVSPVTPAEHIVFSINVSAGGVQISE